MNHCNVLFIHPSAQISSPQFIMMPMGMISLMNELEEYSVRAVNVGLEMSLNPNFDLYNFLQGISFDAVGIDLHWHEHAHSSLEIARTCKEINPNCLVILGGMTASYFAEEILQFCDCADIIISGEAEESLPLLLKRKDASSVPNLVYRDKDKIKKTPAKPASSIDALEFSRIVCLDHWEEYLKCNINMHLKTRFWYDFWLCTGRGCIYDCSYCGGGARAQKKIYRREGISFRSVDTVLQDLLYLQDLGVHVVNLSTDISLADKKYWEHLFASMRREGISMGLYLEAWQLPDRDFIEGVARSWDVRFSTIVITLLSGSESVRKENGKFFSNHAYYKCMELLDKHGINNIPYFATGLPFETVETFKQTLAMTETLLSESDLHLIFCTPLVLDPGSPLYEHPQRYKTITHYHSFKDYYTRCLKRAQNVPYDFSGYHTAFLPGSRIMEMQHQWDDLVRDIMASPGKDTDSLHFL